MTMNAKSIGLALAAGLAVFLIIGIAVTEFAQTWIEFSVFLGIPAGLATGVFTATAVYLGLADDVPAQRRHITEAFVGSSTAFLVVLIVLGGVLDLGITLTLGIAFVVGLVAGIGVYIRGSKGPETNNEDEGTSGIR